MDQGGNDDDDDDMKSGKPTPDGIGSGGAIGEASSDADTGTVDTLREKTDGASSKVVKKACVG